MFKTFIIVSLAVLSCHSQLDIPRRTHFEPILKSWGAPQWSSGAVIAAPGPALAVAHAPTVVAAAPAPVAVAARAPLPIPIHRFQTQEVLPIQDLGVVNGGPQVVQVRSQQEPVLVHYQSNSAPIQVETSHVPSPPGEVTITQSQDEPHHVIHEVIRPVIQEVREIIQPYRRVTQEVRPVQDEVHTDIAANAGQAVAAPVRVAAPAPEAVAAPAPAIIRQPIAVSAPAQAVIGNSYQGLGLIQSPAQAVTANSYNGLGLIQAPAPLLTGSYIQQFIEGLRLRSAQTPLIASRPALTIGQASQAVAVDAAEPIAAEAAVVVPSAPVVARGGGGAVFTRKYVEY